VLAAEQVEPCKQVERGELGEPLWPCICDHSKTRCSRSSSTGSLCQALRRGNAERDGHAVYAVLVTPVQGALLRVVAGPGGHCSPRHRMLLQKRGLNMRLMTWRLILPGPKSRAAPATTPRSAAGRSGAHSARGAGKVVHGFGGRAKYVWCIGTPVHYEQTVRERVAQPRACR
jgi:hypothetical protein